MGWVRVVVTRIWTDGTMYRRMVDTAQQSDPWKWADLTARALAAQPPYRPVPGTAIYHVCADGCTVQVGEYDLDGPLRDLVTVVLAMGREPGNDHEILGSALTEDLAFQQTGGVSQIPSSAATGNVCPASRRPMRLWTDT
jgi:hypothetical protein